MCCTSLQECCFQFVSECAMLKKLCNKITQWLSNYMCNIFTGACKRISAKLLGSDTFADQPHQGKMLRRMVGGLWGRPRNLHSLEQLKYLHSVLSKNQTVTEGNKGLLVETIRSIAEILIWGDQNDSSVFDFFLER